MFEVYYLWDQKSSPLNKGVFAYRVYMKRFDFVEFVVSLQEAFYNGPWGTMNARDRGHLMYK